VVVRVVAVVVSVVVVVVVAVVVGWWCSSWAGWRLLLGASPCGHCSSRPCVAPQCPWQQASRERRSLCGAPLPYGTIGNLVFLARRAPCRVDCIRGVCQCVLSRTTGVVLPRLAGLVGLGGGGRGEKCGLGGHAKLRLFADVQVVPLPPARPTHRFVVGDPFVRSFPRRASCSEALPVVRGTPDHRLHRLLNPLCWACLGRRHSLTGRGSTSRLRQLPLWVSVSVPVRGGCPGVARPRRCSHVGVQGQAGSCETDIRHGDSE
jgi:hypothetical protein